MRTELAKGLRHVLQDTIVRAYSTDLRRRIVQAVAEGVPKKHVAAMFKVSVSTINRYLKQARETGRLEPKRMKGRTPSIGPEDRDALAAQLKAHPQATLKEHCRLWTQAGGTCVSEATMSRAIRRLRLRELRLTEKRRSVAHRASRF